MKTAKLKNGLICISVPMGSINFKNFVGKNDEQYEILGAITKDECSFDCRPFIDDSEFYAKMWKNYNPVGKPSAKSNQCPHPLDSFKSMIENETDFLFENPLGEYHTALKRHIITNTWQQHQDRVIEKLLILKTI